MTTTRNSLIMDVLANARGPLGVTELTSEVNSRSKTQYGPLIIGIGLRGLIFIGWVQLSKAQPGAVLITDQGKTARASRLDQKSRGDVSRYDQLMAA